nr:hypothetical protein [Thermomonospora amylolytica]
MTRPKEVTERVSAYLGAQITPVSRAELVRVADRGPGAVGAWRDRLTPRQLVQVERVAGRELRRLGYTLSVAG